MRKVALDQLLAGRGLAQDLKEARAMVMAGLVFSGSQRLDKAGEMLDPDIPLGVRSKEHPYVGRGGVKLQAALSHWALSVAGMRCVDLGASTGGFTDCLLKAGAARVVAVEAGSNQLDWSLRKDPRVVCLEKFNVLDLSVQELDGPVDFACVDLSLTRLDKVFPVLVQVLKQDAVWVALIKPQYEADLEDLPQGGVISDPNLRQAICTKVLAQATKEGLSPQGLIPSPIQGRDGNLEFLVMGRHKKVIQK